MSNEAMAPIMRQSNPFKFCQTCTHLSPQFLSARFFQLLLTEIPRWSCQHRIYIDFNPERCMGSLTCKDVINYSLRKGSMVFGESLWVIALPL